ncbi:MAG: hypothetical protein P8189_10410 [Anaerolineae bacterium]
MRATQIGGRGLLLLLLFALIFFVRNANLLIASDDAAWLQGRAPTVFDQYRKIPRLFFASLHALFGPSAVAALSMIFFFHALNGFLIYHLGRELLEDRLAALIATAVFLINPITLGTLTWISCFSYVLGMTLALLALLAFLESIKRIGRVRFLWLALALICFGAGLFCSHEIFFLPLLFLVLGWLQGQIRWGAALCAVAMVMALMVNQFVYGFDRYGIETLRLFDLDFALAYASSGLSSGAALSLAYPLSFFAKPLDFLRISFDEPIRWGLTAIIMAVCIVFYRSKRVWRLRLALVLAFLGLITPYIIRLYLTPGLVNYHISYLLSGRVFYLPFAFLALPFGHLISRLYRALQDRRWSWSLFLLPLLAFAYALYHYDRSDFLGLNVIRGISLQMPPPWNPFAVQHPGWLVLPSLAVILAVTVRLYILRRTRSGQPADRP